MGKAVPEQHPAVVLRSHYLHLRALLVAALIAVLGLTATVVIVANDERRRHQLEHAGSGHRVGGTGATGVPQSAPLPQRRLDGAVDTAPAPRYDGGPEEGSADLAPGVNLPARPNQAQAFPGRPSRRTGRPDPAGRALRRRPERGQRRRDDVAPDRRLVGPVPGRAPL